MEKSNLYRAQQRLVPSASASREKLDELVSGHVEQSIEVDASEAELLERSLLRDSGRRHIGLHVRLKHTHRAQNREREREREREKERERDENGGSP